MCDLGKLRIVRYWIYYYIDNNDTLCIGNIKCVVKLLNLEFTIIKIFDFCLNETKNYLAMKTASIIRFKDL